MHGEKSGIDAPKRGTRGEKRGIVAAFYLAVLTFPLVSGGAGGVSIASALASSHREGAAAPGDPLHWG
jgi:hypothetical protein